ncbi:PfkB family carbohydrate kinase [Amycolatopsis benzoatilytica]|uniref:PfkB family carbohydrate kinase n=1 Tax=Amycolatopsis benzoatilytica TaxID=346045 RepID=UPI000376DF37|nr:PfkB family carbohydrate kinase [Amycolatopsis benzoatilytica]
MADPRLVFTGNVIVDLVLAVDAIPEPGGDVVASASTLTAGGGYNTMVAAQRDGLGVVFGGQYGTGPFGDIVRSALASSRFEIVQPGLSDVDSGYCVAMIDASAERTFVTSAGAEGQLTRADLDRIPVHPDDLVYVSGYSLAHPVNAKALPGWLAALPRTVRVLFDPSPLVGDLDPGLISDVLARIDLISVNDREAQLMTGLDDPASAAAELAERVRGRAAIVRTGGTGCWVADAGTPVTHVPAYPVAAVDTNGAGDTHGGVLAAALARGSDLRTAARRANIAAALAVTRHGPATAPTAARIDKALSSG